jgi:hypothetical protein
MIANIGFFLAWALNSNMASSTDESTFEFIKIDDGHTKNDKNRQIHCRRVQRCSSVPLLVYAFTEDLEETPGGGFGGA